MIEFNNSLPFAKELDSKDQLSPFRKKFIIPTHEGKELIYFLGNSLGLQPKQTQEQIQQVLAAWGQYGVEGFFMGHQPWLHYHDQLTKPLSTITGALPHELVVMNQLTVNLHLLLVSFYRPQGNRNIILCEAKAFPSDQYMLETQVKFHGLDPANVIKEVCPREGEHNISKEDILKAIGECGDRLALVLWGGVNYYSGQLFDMESITTAAHDVGAIVGLDLAHAVGNVPLELHNWDVDFACWCSYKYLNSGPGGIGGAYIHERYHKNSSIPRFGGWWGSDKTTRFLMQKGFDPFPSAEGWQLSTPSPVLYACHKTALEIFEEAGWQKLQVKARLMNNYLWFLLQELNSVTAQKIIEFITPVNESEKGCQVSMLMLHHGRRIFDELTKAGVIIDWREPNVIRLAPVPLYNSFEEIWQFTNILRTILQQLS